MKQRLKPGSQTSPSLSRRTLPRSVSLKAREKSNPEDEWVLCSRSSGVGLSEVHAVLP